jgi:pimeloyl-ACP methyl ester carboxylesterase
LHEGHFVVELIDPGVLGPLQPGDNVGVGLERQAGQGIGKVSRTYLASSTRAMDGLGEAQLRLIAHFVLLLDDLATFRLKYLLDYIIQTEPGQKILMNKRPPDTMAGIASLWMEVSGHRVHYLKSGSGPAVVLLHGGASDSRDWLPTMAALSGRFTFYAPDIIGFGQSQRKESGYYLDEFTDFAIELIDRLGLERPAIAGHSFGARVGLDVALLHPEKVSKLVMVDAAGLGRVSRLGSALMTGFWGLRQVLRRRQPYPRFLSREYDDPSWACLEELPSLKTPTLIIWKSHDLYLPAANGRQAARLIPGARLEVLPGWGHAPHRHNTAIFVKLLADFLDSD